MTMKMEQARTYAVQRMPTFTCLWCTITVQLKAFLYFGLNTSHKDVCEGLSIMSWELHARRWNATYSGPFTSKKKPQYFLNGTLSVPWSRSERGSGKMFNPTGTERRSLGLSLCWFSFPSDFPGLGQCNKPPIIHFVCYFFNVGH